LNKFRRILVTRGLAAEKIITKPGTNGDNFNNNQVLVQLTPMGRAEATELKKQSPG
jgi:hypothetical protein